MKTLLFVVSLTVLTFLGGFTTRMAFEEITELRQVSRFQKCRAKSTLPGCVDLLKATSFEALITWRPYYGIKKLFPSEK
jgi:hypothetical protein